MTNIILQFLAYGILIGLSHEKTLIGQNVRDAQPYELLFLVSIAKRNLQGNSSAQDRHLCTGSLISRKSVLTAGHCLVGKKKEDVEIIAGSGDINLGKTYYPESWITYDQWKSNVEVIKHSINEIAIIMLQGAGVKSTKIKPAPVLTFPLQDLYKSKVRIAGWGDSEDDKTPEVLQTAILKVITNEECEAKMTKLIRVRFIVSANYFCSLAKPYVLSSCGDSGAPIINKQNQIVAINLGTCPHLRGYSQNFVHQNQVNSHLNLHNYRDFIRDVSK